MIVGLKVQGFLPNIDFGVDGTGFRHPQHGLNNCPTIDDWDAVAWLDGNGVPKPTGQELTEAPYPPEYQRQLALEAVTANFTYNGVSVGMTDNRLGFYESTNANAATLGDTIINGAEGGALYLATPAEINAFHAAIVAEMATRKNALKTALGL